MSEQKAKRPRGCFFYGCISGAILLVVLLLGALWGLHYFKQMILGFTDSQPVALPTAQLPKAQMDQLQQRVDTFREDVRAGRTPAPLTLTAEEINALIANDPELRSLKDKLYVTMEGDQLKGQVSVPMDQVGLSALKNRYLNAEGTFNLTFNNGELSLTAQNIVVKGKPIPEIYMEKIRKQNLLQSLNQDPRATTALGHLEQIQVKDGKLVITPKPAK